MYDSGHSCSSDVIVPCSRGAFCLSHGLTIVLGMSRGMCIDIVSVIVLLASALHVEGAQVPITSYTCTQPNIHGFQDRGQCTDSRGLWTCAIKEGARPALLSSDVNLRMFGWHGNTNPFVVMDIPQGWCVGSVEMTFVHPSSTPTLSLSVHSAEHLSTNTDRTMFSLLSDNGRTPVMNFTKLARGKYLRINMTSTGRLYLREIEVFGTNDSSCTYPPSAGGDPACPTTSVGSCAYSVTSTLFTPPSSTSATPALSARPTTTSVLSSSSFTTTPMSSQPTGSTDLGCSSTAVTSAVFFAGLLAGVALAGPAGALSVVCYHWKKKQAKTRGKDSMSEYKEPAYDCPLQLEENPAYEAMQK